MKGRPSPTPSIGNLTSGEDSRLQGPQPGAVTTVGELFAQARSWGLTWTDSIQGSWN